MTGLSKITDKILDDARRYAAAKLADADAECKRISDEYAEKAKNITAAANAEAKNEAAQIALRTRATEKTLQKNIMLELRSEMIDRAFEIAKKEIRELDGNERLEFLTGLLCAALWAEYDAQKQREELYGEDGSAIPSAPHPSMKFFVRVPFEVRVGDIMRAGEYFRSQRLPKQETFMFDRNISLVEAK